MNSIKEPIQIPGFPQKISLTQDFIHETIIISDLFKLNEITSVELLLSGEAEMTSNTDMNRGLIAVLGYYSSQKTIVDALRSLLQAQSIIINDNPRAAEVINFSETYCNSLFQNGLYPRLLQLLQNLNIKAEIDKLENQRALGTAKHRRQFCIIFNNIKETLAECIMLRSFNVPLNTKETKSLIEFMRENYRENINNSNTNPDIKKEENATSNVSLEKSVDKCFVYLLISLINSMNPVIKGNSVSNCSKDCFNHPFFTEDEYIKTINDIVQKNITEDTNSTKQNDYGMNSVVQNFDMLIYLAWIISLQKVSLSLIHI